MAGIRWGTQKEGLVVQVCETLDRRRGMTESTMWLAEPPLQEQEEAAEGAEEAVPGPVNPWAELPVAERLRTEYSYCIFCGSQVRSTHADKVLSPSWWHVAGLVSMHDLQGIYGHDVECMRLCSGCIFEI